MKKAEVYRKEAENRVRCLACSHKCLISEGKTGICGVRKNIGGELYSLVYGRIASLNIDPIEKKPLYHFLPGTKCFSIGSVGCNFKCDWCQNFDISRSGKNGLIFGKERKPEDIVNEARYTNCKSIAYTYNEPAVWIEFIKDTAKLARKYDLKNILVTNGYFSAEALGYLDGFIDAVNVDLKSFSDATYQMMCGAKLQPVLDCIKSMHEKKIHLEITTLIIPNINDSEKELEKIAKFIFSLDNKGEIPWHVTRFFPMYKMKDKQVTPIESLKKAEKVGKKVGLKYIHLGNV